MTLYQPKTKNMTGKIINLLIVGVFMSFGLVLFISPRIGFAGQSCPICNGEIGKEKCSDNSCRTTCFPDGIMCDQAKSEGHCANGSCDTGCCGYQKLAFGQSCVNDTINGLPINISPSHTKICLDPGHGGLSDPGAHTVPDTGEYEADWTIKIANDLEIMLKSKGYDVIKTRTNTGIASPGVKLSSADNPEATQTRTKYCYDNNADFMYRIHLDGGDQPQRTWQIVPNQNMDRIYDVSKKYGDSIQKYLIEYLGTLVLGKAPEGKAGSLPIIDGGVHTEGTADYPNNLQGTLVAQSLGGPPVVLSELMNMSPSSIVWLKNPSNYQVLIEGLAYSFSKSIDPLGGGSVAGNKAVAIAKTQLGKPYVFATPTCTRDKWAASPPPKGCPYYDCSKFTDWAWYWASSKKIYLYAYTLSDWAFAVANPGKYKTFHVDDTKNVAAINAALKPGDLLYIGKSGADSYHVVMFVGSDTFIHAPHAGSVVSYGQLSTYLGWSGDVVRPTP